MMAADYDPRKWENDPHLTAEDLTPTDETMEMWRRLGLEPKDIKSSEDAEKYRKWRDRAMR